MTNSTGATVCLSVNDESELPEAIDRLQLGDQRPVILMIGGARSLGPKQSDTLALQMASTVAPLAATVGAVIVTGGTNSGIMKIAGSVFSTHNPKIELVGVAPTGCVEPAGSELDSTQEAAEPNHNLVLVPGTKFGDESPYLIRTIELISMGAKVLTIVAGGGDGTAREYEFCRRRGWPVLALAGSGGFADELAEAAAGRRKPYETRIEKLNRRNLNESESPILPDHSLNAPTMRLRERPPLLVVRLRDYWTRYKPTDWHTGHPFPSNSTARVSAEDPLLCAVPLESRGLARMIQWPLADAAVLKTAWAQAGFMNARANKAQPRFLWVKVLILTLGVVMTAVAVLWTVPDSDTSTQAWKPVTLATLAASDSALLAWVSRRQRDQRWISLRASAEALQRETFRFRCGAGDYSKRGTEESVLARNMSIIEAEQARAVPGLSGPSTPEHWPPQSTWEIAIDEDPLLDALNKRQYIQYRLNNQIDYFARTAGKHDRKVSGATFISLTIASLATVFAATRDAQLISSIAILGSAISATAAWLAMDRSEDRSSRMAATAASLRSILLDWEARDSSGSDRQSHLSNAVTRVERALQDENVEWRRGLVQAQELLATVSAPS